MKDKEMALNESQKRFIKRLAKTLLITITTLSGLLIILLAITPLILTPERVTSMVNKYSNEYLNAEVKIDTASISVFSELPFIGINLHKGEIISKAFAPDTTSAADSVLPYRIPERADTLLKFKEIMVSVSITDLIMSKVSIKRIRLVKPKIYAYVAPDKKTNWDIVNLPEQEDTTSSDDSPLEIKINRLEILENGSITYDSRPDSSLINLKLREMRLDGTFSSNIADLNIDNALFSRFILSAYQISEKDADSTKTLLRSAANFSIDSLQLDGDSRGKFKLFASTHSNFKLNDISLVKNVPLEIEGKIELSKEVSENDSTYTTVQFDKMKVSLAKIPIIFNGKVGYNGMGLTTRKLEGKVNDFEIANLFEYIPEELFPAISDIKTDAAINMEVEIDGNYNLTTGERPRIKSSFTIPSTSIAFKNRVSRINELEADIRAYFSPTSEDSSKVEINKMLLYGRGIRFNVNGEIGRAASADPRIKMQINAETNLDTLSLLFPSKEGSIFTGTLSAQMKVNSPMSRLNAARIGDANLTGNLRSDSVKVYIPKDDFIIMGSGINCNLGTNKNTQDSAIVEGTKMLGLEIIADSLYFKNKEEGKVVASNMILRAHQSASALGGDTTTVHPMRGILTADKLHLNGQDSSALRMNKGEVQFSILPNNGDFKVPHLKIESNVKGLYARDLVNRVGIQNGKIALSAILNLPQQELVKQRRAHLQDSLARIWPDMERDSLIPRMIRERREALKEEKQKDAFSKDDLDLSVDRSIMSLIRKWNLTGTIAAKGAFLYTPYFPVMTSMKNVNFGFTTDKIGFTDTYIKAGKSNFTLTGFASGLRRAMAGRGIITVGGSIESDSLDLNELISATDAGMRFNEMDSKFKDSLARQSNDSTIIGMMESKIADSLASPLIIIPGNLNANLKLNVKAGSYSNLNLEKVTGEMVVKERCLQINDFKAITSAGDMELSAFYATKNKDDLSTGFDLVFKQLEIEKLIELMPSVDTLLPMLKSFKGLVNCQIAATSKIDTTMNIILPSLKGVARINGENLVLMDGDTFAVIAKKLKFKNREKNLINNISVELLVKENKIEVFPFIAQMDRYKFAISGTQNLDMSFYYYISVLKSPIPFRLGVKIFGTMDDFDFKIGKSQFKNDNLPVFSKVIDSTRLNLREQIANIYRIGIDAALKSAGNLQKVEQQIKRSESLYNQDLDSLTKEEQMQLEAIEPVPQPKIEN